ncbi:MAG: DUF5615 family PIN-like protein [Blastocatellia bacterium]|nr:DUF5615 family PIN-like protein [Blastocatellia bacterium]
MNFLVDAQLPRRLVTLLRQAGYDAIHTLDLTLGNRTIDTLFLANIDRIAEAFDTFDFIEINRTNVIFHS